MPAAYNAVPVVATGDWITAGWVNTYIGGNLSAVWPYTAGGDMAYAVTGTTLDKIAKPTNDGLFVMQSGGTPVYLQGGTANSGKFVRVKADGTYELGTALQITLLTGSGDQTVSAGNPVLWATEVIDDGGWHSTVSNTGRITVADAGRYRPACVLGLWTPTGAAVAPYNASLRINGTIKIHNRKAVYQDGSMFTLEFPSVPLVLSAGDYLEITYDKGGVVNMVYSYFSLERMP